MSKQRMAYHIDRMNRRIIEGWICNLDNPNVSVQFQLFLGEQQIASGKAQSYREDLQAAGYGNGTCAFREALDPTLLGLLRGPLRLVIGDEVIVVADEAAVDSYLGSDVVGAIEWATPTHLAGWAFDRADPQGSLIVELGIDGSICAQTLADKPRESAVDEDGVGHDCGFLLDAQHLDLHRRSGIAEVIAAGIVIHTMTLPIRELGGSIDVISEMYIKGWVCNTMDPSEKMSVTVVSLDGHREYPAIYGLYNTMLRGSQYGDGYINFVFQRGPEVPPGLYKVVVKEGKAPFDDVIVEFVRPAPLQPVVFADLIASIHSGNTQCRDDPQDQSGPPPTHIEPPGHHPEGSAGGGTPTMPGTTAVGQGRRPRIARGVDQLAGIGFESAGPGRRIS